VGGREARVGVFVILGLLSVVAVLFLMTDPATLRGRYMVVTSHPDAGGIRKGDPVQMRGVNIGRVNSFEMVGSGVNVTLEIEGAWRIPVDSHTRLAGQGIFGGRTMEVVPGTSSQMVEEWGMIPAATADTGLLETAESVGAEAQRVMEQLNLLLAEPTVSTLKNTTSELQALVGDLREAVLRQRDEINDLTASLNRSAAGLETAAGAAPDVARAAARADSTLVRLLGTSATLDHAVVALDDVLTRMQAGEGTLGRLSRDDALYVNLNRAAEALTLLVTDVRENPRRYIRIGIFGF
jgi:phospholipid/cholesterol/gamma-HCH transport system substrate-binding protein